MPRRKKLSKTAIDVLCKTEYDALVEIVVKDTMHIGIEPEGNLYLFEKGLQLPFCKLYGSHALLGAYKGFGRDTDKDIAIRLEVIGKLGTLELKVCHIESMTVYKGKKYNL